MHMYTDTYMRLEYCLTVTEIFNLCIGVHMHSYVYACACMRVYVHVYMSR